EPHGDMLDRQRLVLLQPDSGAAGQTLILCGRWPSREQRQIQSQQNQGRFEKANYLTAGRQNPCDHGSDSFTLEFSLSMSNKQHTITPPCCFQGNGRGVTG